MKRQPRDFAELELAVQEWLANGGMEEVKKGAERARRTSAEFARQTRVRWRTLYIPWGGSSSERTAA